MANHVSALKRARSSSKKRLRNRYQKKTTNTFIKKLALVADPKEQAEKLSLAYSMVDKLAKKNLIHKNRSAKIKSRLAAKARKVAEPTH